MQHSALSEAEQLIQSWLRDENNVHTFPSLTLLGERPSHPLTCGHPLLPPATNITPLDQRHWSGVEGGTLSSQSVPHLTSYDAVDVMPGSLPPTVLLPTTGLLTSTTDLLPDGDIIDCLNSNSNSDTSSHLPYSSTQRSTFNTKVSSRSLSNHLLAFNKRHKSNSYSDNLLTHPQLEGDLLSTQDWGEGEVGENVDSIVQALMKKTVSSAGEGARRDGRGRNKRGQCDPRVTMEMRHRQVRERRQARDEKKKKEVRQRQREKEAWQEAERLVREGEREEGRRRRREEVMVAEQMTAIRRQVQEETERKRRHCSVGVSSGKPHLSLVLGVTQREAVMECAGECVRGEGRERKRRENRAELIRQLEEVELSERKERSKVLRHAISTWYGVVMEERAKLRRAAAWWAWHVMVRVWGVWRGYVRGQQEKREQNRVAREMQRERRLIGMAVKHYHKQLLHRCVGGWMVEVGRERGRREREEEERKHRERVQAFLEAATLSVTTKEKEKEGDKDVLPQPFPLPSPPRRTEETVRGGHRKTSRKTPPPVMWQAARKHVDDLLSSVAPPSIDKGEESECKDHTPRMRRGTVHRTPDLTVRGDEEGGEEVVRGEREVGGDEGKEKAPSGRGGGKDRGRTVGKPITCVPPAVWPPRPRPKPVTKSIPMSGMQARSEAMAERRRKRQEREKEREREREERVRREEEERKEQEREEREALAARRREERKIAKQREVERLERQKREKEQRALAVTHYTASLLRGRGMRPWRMFMEKMKAQRRTAEHFHLHWRLQRAVSRWQEVMRRRLSQREQAADNLHHRMLKRRAWQGWREYLHHWQCLEAVCENWAKVLLSRVVFRAWQRATCTSRREGWERQMRAKMHHTRRLKRRVLLSWQCYVPLSREEREKEVRRAELRRKVTQWLPDYQPLDFDQDNR